MTSTPYRPATAPLFTALDARRDGWSAQKLADKVRSGEIMRIAKGCYVGMTEFRALHPEQRHVLRVEATLPTFSFPVVASHYSALALHDIPIWGADLSRIHFARVDAGERYSRRGVAVHPSYGPRELVVIEGLRAVHPTIAVLGTAMVCGIESGVVAADGALASGLTTIDHLHEWLDRMAGFPKVSRAWRAVELAEPRTESPGESRTRLVLNSLDLGPVRPQVEIYDESGAFVGRVDFLLPRHRLIVEFDGLMKYGPDDAREAIIAEKVREDQLRALGYGVARVVWRDLGVAGRIEAKVRRARLGR
ncbi:hypothetical protein CLV47_10516 [Antricoccus suffuscus]|uniref:Uncharacterized protein n=1 Tax=Antricoccus suffuscus TaxID=1629062 RepID=A0A2T1A241_9ACTN|nr:hypothetical protein [Antricoccus suffuscus]PRZ42398.1 hypothetical protein CLV47_10516 [Antricoccus suffuscus]